MRPGAHPPGRTPTFSQPHRIGNLMPFGLNTKSVVVGLLFGYFVAPRATSLILGQVSKLRGSNANAA